MLKARCPGIYADWSGLQCSVQDCLGIYAQAGIIQVVLHRKSSRMMSDKVRFSGKSLSSPDIILHSGGKIQAGIQGCFLQTIYRHR